MFTGLTEKALKLLHDFLYADIQKRGVFATKDISYLTYVDVWKEIMRRRYPERF